MGILISSKKVVTMMMKLNSVHQLWLDNILPFTFSTEKGNTLLMWSSNNLLYSVRSSVLHFCVKNSIPQHFSEYLKDPEKKNLQEK